jgi:hypothetical protein
MVGNWWHLAETPSGRHAHQLDPIALQGLIDAELAADPNLDAATAEAEVLGDEAERIRRELGFPSRARWLSREGWSSSLSQGEPHASFLAVATVHRGS